MLITVAVRDDLAALSELDKHVSRQTLITKIDAGQIFIVREDEKIVGWLRFGFFWDEYPFMNLLFVLSEFRGVGFGKALVTHWENKMKEQGCKLVMTSTLSDENAQHFYRKLNYQDVGGFILPGEPLELVLIKELV